MAGCDGRLLQKGARASAESNFWIAITRKAQTLQLSHPLLQKDISRFSCDIAGTRLQKLTAYTLFEPCDRKTLRSAPVIISASSKGHDLMVNWADAQAGSRALQTTPQESGWNSWDYYRWTITEEEFTKTRN